MLRAPGWIGGLRRAARGRVADANVLCGPGCVDLATGSRGGCDQDVFGCTAVVRADPPPIHSAVLSRATGAILYPQVPHTSIHTPVDVDLDARQILSAILSSSGAMAAMSILSPPQPTSSYRHRHRHSHQPQRLVSQEIYVGCRHVRFSLLY